MPTLKEAMPHEAPMEQLALACGGMNKRPEKTEAMRRQAAAELVARLVKSGAIEANDAEDSVDDIIDVTRWGETDGYRIARKLEERRLWDCDLHMAEELDQFEGILNSLHAAAEKQWAADNPRPPQFGEGDTVRWRGGLATVHGVHYHRPQCYKIRQGQMSSPSAYFVVPFEDVTEIPQGEQACP